MNDAAPHVMAWRIPEVRRGHTPVLREGTLEVPRGRNVAVAGLNGAGKTTLFLHLLGALRGSRVSSTTQVGRTAYQPQDVPIPPIMTVRQFGHLVHGVEFGRFEAEYSDLGVGQLASRRMGELSKGEAQFIYLAFTLLQDADLIILDEPTASLDMRRRAQAQELLQDRKTILANSTLLVSSQVPEVLLRTCTHLVCVAQGTITYAGDLAAVIPAGGQSREQRFEEALLSLIDPIPGSADQ